MSRRYCPVCGRDLNSSPHAPGCLQQLRGRDRESGPRVPILLVLLFWLALAAGIVTWLGQWPGLLYQLHQLAHGIAPGIIH